MAIEWFNWKEKKFDNLSVVSVSPSKGLASVSVSLDHSRVLDG
jgi:membrane-bound metal-dependent hydrolase YbcI (DUF457 family)